MTSFGLDKKISSLNFKYLATLASVLLRKKENFEKGAYERKKKKDEKVMTQERACGRSLINSVTRWMVALYDPM